MYLKIYDFKYTKNCGELEEDSKCSILEHMGNNCKQSYNVRYFNLDMIMSVGYLVGASDNLHISRRQMKKIFLKTDKVLSLYLQCIIFANTKSVKLWHRHL